MSAQVADNFTEDLHKETEVQDGVSSGYDETENRIYAVMNEDFSSEQIIQYYEKWADTYDKDLTHVAYNPPVIGATELANLYSGKHDIRILDCAAGTGLVAEELKKLGFQNVDALDPCQGMLDKAEKKNIYKNFIKDFLGTNRLPIEDGAYDAIVSVGCFCEGHVKANCLPEMARVVKPGGKIVIAMREKWLHTVADLRENLEPTMQGLHDNGTWKWVTRKVVERYHEDVAGLVYIFEIL